jgi:ATP-binding cassette subfamily C (CFTR/MRP) protein 1
VVILDDVLSALDNNTAESVLERLLGKSGLFRKLGTTVILTTHAGMSTLAPVYNASKLTCRS